MNKRTPIIKYLYTSKCSKTINTEKEMTDMVKNWENIEKSIRNKKIIGEIQDIRNDSQYIIRNRNNDIGYLLYKYFKDKNHEKILEKIFTNDEIKYFKDNNFYSKLFNYDNLAKILLFYKDYKFESKKEDIALIEKIIEKNMKIMKSFLKIIVKP